MRVLVCLTLLCALGVSSLDAQRWRDRHRDRDGGGWWRGDAPAEFGVRGGYDFAEEVGLAGAQVRIPLVRQLLLTPSADVFFDDAQTEWQANADLLVSPSAFGGLYLGAGVAFMNRDFDLDGEEDVEAGYNLLLGISGARLFDTRVRPFAEARWTEVEDYDPFRLVLGINVPLR